MNKRPSSHLQDDRILLYLDGELDSAAAASIHEHLDACWSCRMQADRIHKAIVEYARFRERQPIPEPPAPWRDLAGDFRRSQVSSEPLPFLKRIRTGTSLRTSRLAVFCGVATAIAAVGWLSTSVKPPRSIAPSPHVSLPETSPKVTVTIPPPPANHVSPSPIRVEPLDTLHEQLAVTAELHRLGADLGESIEMTKDPAGRLLVSGYGLSNERKSEIQASLARLRAVEVRFPEPSAQRDSPLSPDRPAIVARRPIAFEQQLLQYTGGRQQLEALTNALLEASDRITIYAHAIHALAERFGPDERAALNGPDQALLASIQSDYEIGVRSALDALESRLRPVLTKLAVAPTPASTANLLESSLRLDRDLNAALAGSASGLNDHDLYADLRGLMQRIRELIQR